jgi:hypothetical protein
MNETESYDSVVDGALSWADAIAAIRDQYRATCRKQISLLFPERVQRGVTRPQLAALLHVSTAALQSWENGSAFPPPDLLVRWAAALRRE